MDKWISAVKKLAEVAGTQPHAAFAAFTHCLQGQWTFLSRTMPDCAQLFEPLEQAIRAHLIRALFKRYVNDLERDLLSLPARMGGMGIFKPTEECLISSTNSAYISAPLVRLIQRQEYDFDPRELVEEMKSLRADVDSESDARFKAKRDLIMEHAPAELKLAAKAASEKGASSWVTAAPSYEHGTALHKGEFGCLLHPLWMDTFGPPRHMCKRSIVWAATRTRLQAWRSSHHST